MISRLRKALPVVNHQRSAPRFRSFHSAEHAQAQAFRVISISWSLFQSFCMKPRLNLGSSV
jgi:hypothetical protein